MPLLRFWKYINDNFYNCSSKIIIHQYSNPRNLTILNQLNLLPFINICILILQGRLKELCVYVLALYFSCCVPYRHYNHSIQQTPSLHPVLQLQLRQRLTLPLLFLRHPHQRQQYRPVQMILLLKLTTLNQSTKAEK